MENRKLLRILATGLLVVATPVFYLNVEKTAERLGADQVMADAVAPKQGREPGPVANALTSPEALYLALIAFGFFVGVWVDFLARSWDHRVSPKDKELCAHWEAMKELADRVDEQLRIDPDRIPVELHSLVEAKCISLHAHGFERLRIARKPARSWLGFHQLYFRALWPILKEGHVKDAQRHARMLQETLTTVEAERLQSPPDTESETRP